MDETVFYLGETGKDMWVHVGCIPCFWHNGLDEDGNRLTRPRLRPICTEWGVKVYGEFEEWCESTSPDDEVLPHFRLMKGYPKEKFMRDRIVRAVKRFQALWRGYIYKKAYPEALRAARATEALNLNAYATLSIPPLCSQNAQKRNDFLHQNSIGAQMEILMDKNHPSVALYSAEVIKIQGVPEIDGLYYWVKFHHDDEVRRYHWKRLMGLKLDCECFKSKHGIVAQITGKLPLYKFFYP